MKRFALLLLSLLLLATAFSPRRVSAQTAGDFVNIEVFERKDCGHCIAEKAFLTDLQKKRTDLRISFHDIAEPEHRKHFNELTKLENIPRVTPITIIGSAVIQGFDTAETTGRRIENLIRENAGKPQYTFNEFIKAGGSKSVEQAGALTCDVSGAGCAADEPFFISIPFIGPVDIMRYSLPTLSVVLGFVDGFNPCAMWVLVMLLTLLIQAGSKRRMWEMAGLFILAETIMYYAILNAWMTAWDFVGMDRIVTPIVGLVSIGAGGFFLHQFFFSDSTCKVGGLEHKRRTHEKIKYYVTAPMTVMTALGILALAFSVNIIEFACSIGIPQAFTKILDINGLSWISRQFYMAIYIFFYMIDDLVVFAAALYSFERIGLTAHKCTRISHLIGGAVMLALGLILLFEPTWLIFS